MHIKIIIKKMTKIFNVIWKIRFLRATFTLYKFFNECTIIAAFYFLAK